MSVTKNDEATVIIARRLAEYWDLDDEALIELFTTGETDKEKEKNNDENRMD